MFKITQTPRYFWPVKVRLPKDGGQFDEHTFDAQFRRLSQAEVDAMRQDAARVDYSDAAAAAKVLVGWKGITTADDQEFPYSETNQAALLDIPGVASAIMVAFLESLMGARRGN